MSASAWTGAEARGRIVYVGPALSGKTTNLETLARNLPDGRLSGVATAGERTLLFDFLPLRAPSPDDVPLRLNLHTVPGQTRYREARKMVLRSAGVLVFVADSDPLRLSANRYALDDVREILAELGRDPARVPVVFQYNKRDTPGAVPLCTLDGLLNPGRAAAVASVAPAGIGVFRTLSLAISLIRTRMEPRLGRVPAGPPFPSTAGREPPSPPSSHHSPSHGAQP